MTLDDALTQGIFPLVFLVWAETRFLPLVRTAVGWAVAHARKAGVTEAQAREAASHLIFPK